MPVDGGVRREVFGQVTPITATFELIPYAIQALTIAPIEQTADGRDRLRYEKRLRLMSQLLELLASYNGKGVSIGDIYDGEATPLQSRRDG